MKRLFVLFTLGLLVPSSAFSTDSLSKEDVTTAALLAAGAFASYLVYSWATHKSDAQVIDHAQQLIQSIEHDYQQLLLLSQRYTDTLVESGEFSLNALLSTCYSVCLKNKEYSLYLSRLEYAMSELAKLINESKKRMDHMRKQPQQEQLYHRACTVLEHMLQLQGSLRIMHTLLTTHESYFKLQSLYDLLYQRYTQVLSTAYQLNTNPYLIEAIADQIQQALLLESQYIYLDFYAQLQTDCKQLAATLKTTTRNYNNLNEQAHALLSWLEYVAQSVAGSNRFALELFYKQTRMIDEEMDQLMHKQNALLEKHERAVRLADLFAQRSIAFEMNAVSRSLIQLQLKKEELRSKLTQQSSNSFPREYRSFA